MRKRRVGMTLLMLVIATGFAFATGAGEAAVSTEGATVRATIYDRGRIASDLGTMADNAFVDLVNESLPFDVEYVVYPRWEQEELLNAAFAAGDAPDYVFSYGAGYNKGKYAEGLTLALDDYLQYAPTTSEFVEQYPLARQTVTMPDGNMHFFPIGQRIGPNWTLFVRTDWLDNLGLEIPTTAEELYDVAYAFTYDDPDGNGEDDTLGINLSWIGALMVDIMFGRAENDFYIEDGEYVLNWDRLEASTAFKKQLYDDGLVDRDFLTDNNGNKAKQDFLTGRLGLYFANNGVRDGNLHLAFLENFPEGSFVPIAFPETEFGSFNPIHDAPYGGRSFVNSQTDVPEAAVQYGDFMQQIDTYIYLTYGTEGQTFELNSAGIPEFTVDSDERNRLFGWTTDLRNHFPQILLPQVWVSPETRYLDRGPEWDMVYDSYVRGIEIYLDPDKEYPWTPIDGNSMPVLPSSLELVTASRQEVYDIWTRAIVSGDALTIAEAREQAEAMWDSIGGAQLEEFYAEWFEENQDSVVYAQQWYDSPTYMDP